MDEIPIVCDMTDAPDTAEERLALYGELFAFGLLGRDRTRDGIRWRLRHSPQAEALACELAARENACCAFMTTTVTVHGQEIRWETTTIDDLTARGVLDLLYDLPDVVGDGADALYERFSGETGVPIVRDGSVVRPEVGSPSEDALEREDAGGRGDGGGGDREGRA